MAWSTGGLYCDQKKHYMATSFSFLHLSDIHFTRWSNDHYDLDKDLRNEFALDLENLKKQRQAPIDAIFVTGDIAHSGSSTEYEAADEWLLRISSILDCNPSKIWTTPGNHDVDRRCSQSPMLQRMHIHVRSSLPDDVSNLVGGYLRDPIGGKLIFKPLEQYNIFAAKYGCSINEERPYWEHPELAELENGMKITAIGLNSVLISTQDDSPENGEKPGNMILGRYQVPIRQKNVLYITLCHHPWNWLLDKQVVEGALNRRAQIQLFGHTHEHQVDLRDTYIRLNAGALHPDRKQPGWEPRYNLVQLSINENDKSQLQVTIYSRRWSNAKHEFCNSKDGAEFAPTTYSLTLSMENPEPQRSQKMETSDEEKFASNAVEPLSVDEAMRELVYRFLMLSFYDRIDISQSLGLFQSEDENLPDTEKFKLVLRRAQERNLVHKLLQEIQHREQRGAS